MQVRITWRSETFIEGESLKEIKEKFEGGEGEDTFVELVSVEDVPSFKDLTSEFNHI